MVSASGSDVMRDIDAAQEWRESWAAGVDGDAARAVELTRRLACRVRGGTGFRL
jgi:hypothetical protein